jgi:LPS-assembly protein
MNSNKKLESGTSSTLGFEYKYQEKKEKGLSRVNKNIFTFSAGQIIKDENNNNLPAPINSKSSDLIGTMKWNPTEKFSITNNYSIDQNYKEFNSNEIETELDLNKVKFNLSYLEEKNYFLEQEYVQSKINFNTSQNTALSFGGKRNLLKDSSEYYNLAYEYFNDCLKAGIAYRREFYTDRDIEPTNTLMFTISIIPFAEINSPGFSK